MNTIVIIVIIAIIVIAIIIFLASSAIYFLLLSERLKKQLNQTVLTLPANDSELSQSIDDIRIVVDYTKTLEQAIAEGNYDGKNINVIPENFFIYSKMAGEKVVSGRLFHFNCVVSNKRVIKKMNKDGFRPATIIELLTLGAVHPELQKQFSIIALGSVWRDPDNIYRAPFLSTNLGYRLLSLCYSDGNWDAGHRFFGIRK